MELDLGVGVLWFIAFLFSTTVHEAMHALAALRLGDATAYHGGQVSLNPVPHIRREPIGMLVLPLFTALTQGWVIGWASAPYDPRWAQRYPGRAAIMAAAGPAGNLMIAFASLVVLKVALLGGWFVAPNRVGFASLVEMAGGGSTFLTSLLSILLIMNVFLCIFNLLPLPPLDGSAVLRGVLPTQQAKAFESLQANPMMSMVGLLVAWKVFPILTAPLFGAILRVLHPAESYS